MEALSKRQQTRYEKLRNKVKAGKDLTKRETTEYRNLNDKITEWGNKNTGEVK